EMVGDPPRLLEHVHPARPVEPGEPEGVRSAPHCHFRNPGQPLDIRPLAVITHEPEDSAHDELPGKSPGEPGRGGRNQNPKLTSMPPTSVQRANDRGKKWRNVS